MTDEREYRAHIKALANATQQEGKRLAQRVKRGEITRAEIEAMLEESGEVEPLIALQYLNRWEIR